MDIEGSGIYATESAYLERFVQFGAAGGRVISVSFPRTPDEEASGDHPLLDRIGRYLDGTREDFGDVEVGLTIQTDHRAVLEALREIGYGEQATVERLTAMTAGLDPHEEADQELVRAALADNPVPLIVPDHRVRDGPSGAPPDVEQKLRSLEGL